MYLGVRTEQLMEVYLFSVATSDALFEALVYTSAYTLTHSLSHVTPPFDTEKGKRHLQHHF